MLDPPLGVAKEGPGEDVYDGQWAADGKAGYGTMARARAVGEMAMSGLALCTQQAFTATIQGEHQPVLLRSRLRNRFQGVVFQTNSQEHSLNQTIRF